MRVFKNAWFERFTRKQCVPDKALLDAIERAERGLIDADLGSGVLKQRVVRKGQGKSVGFRTTFCIARQNVLSSSMASPRATVTTLRTMKRSPVQEGIGPCPWTDG